MAVLTLQELARRVKKLDHKLCCSIQNGTEIVNVSGGPDTSQLNSIQIDSNDGSIYIVDSEGNPTTINASDSDDWSLNGNLTTGTEFIGTTGGDALRFRASNTQFMELQTNGRLAIVNTNTNTAVQIDSSRITFATGVVDVRITGASAASTTERSVYGAKSSTMLTGGRLNALVFGVNESTRNCGFLSFAYAGGSTSVSNYISFSFAGVGDAWQLRGDASMTLLQIATPAAPTANRHAIYPKSDSRFYHQNSSGVESKILSSNSTTNGIATLVGGTVVVNTTAIATGGTVQLTVNTPGGTLGFLSVPAASIVNGTSFTVNSSSATDTSTVNWTITS